MLNETKIRYFLTLAKHLNFSAAAKELYITQQALSKQISQLEQELDCVLFVRKSRGVLLTESGHIMEKAFRSMQNGLEQALLEVKKQVRSSENVINIGCAAGIRLAPFLSQYCNEFAKIRDVKFWLGQPETHVDLINWLAEGKFDVVFCTDDYGDCFTDLNAMPVCVTPQYFFVNKKHPAASSNAVLKDFQEMPFYVVDNEAHTNRVLSICAKERFVPVMLSTTANPYSTYLMTEMGYAVSFGTGMCILHTNPSVRAYRLKHETAHLMCVWNPEFVTPLTREFVEYLSKHTGKDLWYYPSQDS